MTVTEKLNGYGPLAGIKVVDLTYRRCHGSSAACSSLVDIGKLVDRYVASLYLYAHVACKLHHALIGDGWENERDIWQWAGMRFGWNM